MNLPIIGNTGNRTALVNNRARTTASGKAAEDQQEAIADPVETGALETKSGTFVERRTSQDRRKKNTGAMIDTRRSGDRRRSRVDVTV